MATEVTTSRENAVPGRTIFTISPKPIFGVAFRLTDEGWRRLTVRWTFFFFLLAIVNEVMWRFFSTDTWIASKMLLSFPLTLVFAFLQVPLLRRHWDGEENPFAAKD